MMNFLNYGLSHAYTLNSTCKLIDILDDMIWMLATIVGFTGQGGCLTPSHLVT